jgi:TIR domain
MYHARHAPNVRRGLPLLTAQVCTTFQTHPNCLLETPMATPVARKKIFISYSHGDEAWFKELQARLVPLQRRHGFEVWDDKHLQPGQDWHAEIQKALGETKLALLLVSPNFIRSEYIDKHELKPLQDAHANGEGVTVAPLYLRNADVDDYPFITRLQGLNDPAKPLERLKEKQADLDDEFVAISRKIKALMQAPAADQSAPMPAPLRSRAAEPQEATSDDGDGDDGYEDDADGGEEDVLPLSEMIADALQAMFDEPGQQALALSADDGEETTLLLMLTEGAEDNLICEIAANDELHPDLKLDRKTIRTLIDDFGFVEPEYRGDRLWKDLGPIDSLDARALGEDLAALLEEGFGAPNEDLDVVSSIYAV